MNTHTDKTQENKNKAVANAVSQKQSGGGSTFQFADNRPEAIAQRKLQEMGNNTQQVSQLRAFQDMANSSPRAKQVAQLQAIADDPSIQQQQLIHKKENNVGLSNNLKSSIESRSNMSMDNVNAVQLMKKKGTPLDGAHLRVDQFGDNWSTLDRETYMKNHDLKEQSSKFAEGKFIKTLKDGSIILTDTTGQYWRHEHAQNVGQYYDKNHTVSANNADTHFWISSNQKKKVQDTVQLKKS